MLNIHVDLMENETELYEENEERSCSMSSSSSSSSDKWFDSPIIIGRAECFRTRNHTHIEDRNPYQVISQLTDFAWARNSFDLKITINDIIIPMRNGNLDHLREDIMSTIENQKHFFTKGDFEL